MTPPTPLYVNYCSPEGATKLSTFSELL